MKIINLKAENIKKIKAVDITPTDNTVIITGKNGQGKSSVLDSILYALGGKDALKNTPKPIREGETSASIEIDLGDYKVIRTWNALGTTRLEVLSKDGAKFSSPQALLDEIVGRIAFDPLAFSQMKPEEQKSVLLEVLGLTGEVSKLQSEYKVKFDERTLVGRDLKTAQGHLDSLPVIENPPKELIDITELSKKISDAEENNREVEDLEEELESYENEIRELEEKLEQAKENLAETKKDLSKQKRIDTTELQKKMDSSEENNDTFRKALERTKAKAEVDNHTKKQKDLTTSLAEILGRKEKLIMSAKLPIEGLNIDEEGVTFKKIPFSQLSSAEKLKVSLAIAMAMNPKLRVMRIMDGSLLDTDNMTIIRQMAKNEDYQVWIERVEDNTNVGFMLEEGEIKK